MLANCQPLPFETSVQVNESVDTVSPVPELLIIVDVEFRIASLKTWPLIDVTAAAIRFTRGRVTHIDQAKRYCRLHRCRVGDRAVASCRIVVGPRAVTRLARYSLARWRWTVAAGSGGMALQAHRAVGLGVGRVFDTRDSGGMHCSGSANQLVKRMTVFVRLPDSDRIARCSLGSNDALKRFVGGIVALFACAFADVCMGPHDGWRRDEKSGRQSREKESGEVSR